MTPQRHLRQITANAKQPRECAEITLGDATGLLSSSVFLHFAPTRTLAENQVSPPLLQQLSAKRLLSAYWYITSWLRHIGTSRHGSEGRSIGRLRLSEEW